VSVQRAIEMLGISTVVITVEPEESRQARPPRAFAPEFATPREPGFSVGRTFGRPHDSALHRAILRDALLVLASPGEPGRIEVRRYD
jgi:hypothetical protein